MPVVRRGSVSVARPERAMDIECERTDESELRSPSAGVCPSVPHTGLGNCGDGRCYSGVGGGTVVRTKCSDLTPSWLSRHSHTRYPSHGLASQFAIPDLASDGLGKASRRAPVPPEATRQGGAQWSVCGRKRTIASPTKPYVLRSTKAELMPPKPNEFDTTTFARTSRPEPGTKSRSQAGSGVCSPTVGGIQPR